MNEPVDFNLGLLMGVLDDEQWATFCKRRDEGELTAKPRIRRYVHKTGFGCGTLFIERTGDEYVCVGPGGRRGVTQEWMKMEDRCVSEGSWVEV